MEKQSKDIFFVGIHESDEVRRNILESLKDIVENLQRFEKFKEARKVKIENINKLGSIINEINKLLPNLKNSLPETKIRAVKVNRVKETVAVKTVKTKTPVEIVKRKPLNELQKLESELGEIEDKLKDLK